MLARALAGAGLDDVPTYTTNAVKHFLATIHPSAVLRAPDGERDDA